jgi:hypothetical protein
VANPAIQDVMVKETIHMQLLVCWYTILPEKEITAGALAVDNSWIPLSFQQRK